MTIHFDWVVVFALVIVVACFAFLAYAIAHEWKSIKFGGANQDPEQDQNGGSDREGASADESES